MVGCFNASAAAGSEMDVCGASCLACQRQFGVEENSRDMVVCPWVTERALQNSSLD